MLTNESMFDIILACVDCRSVVQVPAFLPISNDQIKFEGEILNVNFSVKFSRKMIPVKRSRS